MSRLNFKLIKEVASGSQARAGSFKTLHSEVSTPVFMPVGTQATVRGQRFELLESLGFPVLLANTYHLMLRPGPEVFKKMGGISRFMGWNGSVLTDSGGFQIFSLPNDRQMSEEGALFKSYVDNRSILLTPERSIEMQKAIGSDIMMVLDQCVPSTVGFKEAEAAMKLTHRWAKRSLEARGDSLGSLFGIIQGACFPELRKISAECLTSMPFDGFAIGGLAVGEGKSEREDLTEFTTSLMPKNLPRYLMGVGTPLDLLEAVHRGVDMFDCILPTALGQQGVAYTSKGKIDLRRGVYRYSEDKLDKECSCATCNRHSISYLHHLIRVKENLGGHMVAAHNLCFYAKLMREMRASILDDTFLNFYQEKKEALASNNASHPVTLPKVKKRRKTALELGQYKVYETRPGVHSILHIPSGEVMHAKHEPMEEVLKLYIEQSALCERISEQNEKELVIWDIGLGAGFNAMAAIAAYEKNKEAVRAMHLASFENNLDSFRLALKHPNLFHHLRHGAPRALLERQAWTSKTKPLSWALYEGDFQDRIKEAKVPDIIFFDPFSLHTDLSAWSLDCFKNIFQVCKDHPTEIFTYSSSTAVRALFLAAGFFVAKGVSIGSRAETTVLLSPKAAKENKRHLLLSHEWLSLWERSQAKFPASLSSELHLSFENTIRSHDQFL